MTEQHKFCGQCGEKNVLENKYCNFCGSRFPHLEPDPPKDDPHSYTLDTVEELPEPTDVRLAEEDQSTTEPLIPQDRPGSVENNEQIFFEKPEDNAPALGDDLHGSSSNSHGILEQKLTRLIEHTGQLTVQGEQGVMFLVCETEQNVLHIILSSAIAFSAPQQHILEALGFTEVDYNFQRTINFSDRERAVTEGAYLSRTVFEEVYGEGLTGLKFIEDFKQKVVMNRISIYTSKRNILYITVAVTLILIFLLLIVRLG